MQAKDHLFLENKDLQLVAKALKQDQRQEFFIRIKIFQNKKKTLWLVKNFNYVNKKLNIFLYQKKKKMLKF